MTTLYGINNCDTVRKAKKWLTDHQIDFTYVDFRKADFSEAHIQGWLTITSLTDIVNPRSQAWKKLSETEQQQLLEKADLALLVQTPTLIKRPVLQTKNKILFGFNETDYKNLLK